MKRSLSNQKKRSLLKDSYAGRKLEYAISFVLCCSKNFICCSNGPFLTVACTCWSFYTLSKRSQKMIKRKMNFEARVSRVKLLSLLNKLKYFCRKHLLCSHICLEQSPWQFPAFFYYKITGGLRVSRRN